MVDEGLKMFDDDDYNGKGREGKGRVTRLINIVLNMLMPGKKCTCWWTGMRANSHYS